MSNFSSVAKPTIDEILTTPRRNGWTERWCRRSMRERGSIANLGAGNNQNHPQRVTHYQHMPLKVQILYPQNLAVQKLSSKGVKLSAARLALQMPMANPQAMESAQGFMARVAQ